VFKSGRGLVLVIFFSRNFNVEIWINLLCLNHDLCSLDKGKYNCIRVGSWVSAVSWCVTAGSCNTCPLCLLFPVHACCMHWKSDTPQRMNRGTETIKSVFRELPPAHIRRRKVRHMLERQNFTKDFYVLFFFSKFYVPLRRCRVRISFTLLWSGGTRLKLNPWK